MAIQRLPGPGLLIPEYMVSLDQGLNSGLLIDATGEKAAMIGSVWFAERTGTKAIRKIKFLFGVITKAGGSALTVSLQDVSTASGNPGRPDETQDQTVAIANANASFASNTWITTGNLSADRTVSYGDIIAVVIEFDGAGRLGSDAVRIDGLNNSGLASTHGFCALKTGGTWAANTVMPNVVFEFSDGSEGTFMLNYLITTIDSNAGNIRSDTTPDEWCLEFSVPYPMEIDGLYVADVAPTATTADFELILYSGTTALRTVTVSAIKWRLTNFTGPAIFPVDPYTLAANTTYRVAVRPTTTSANLRICRSDVNTAAHLALMRNGCSVGGVNTRTDQGAWGTVTATRRFAIGVVASGFDDGVSTGKVGVVRFDD